MKASSPVAVCRASLTLAKASSSEAACGVSFKISVGAVSRAKSRLARRRVLDGLFLDLEKGEE